MASAVTRSAPVTRMRWNIEECVRHSRPGLRSRMTDIGDQQCMIQFVAAEPSQPSPSSQLVKARDGTTTRNWPMTSGPVDNPLSSVVRLGGPRTERQKKQPFPKARLAFAAWVIARLGGGPATMGKTRSHGHAGRGLDGLRRIKTANTLEAVKMCESVAASGEMGRKAGAHAYVSACEGPPTVGQVTWT